MCQRPEKLLVGGRVRQHADELVIVAPGSGWAEAVRLARLVGDDTVDRLGVAAIAGRFADGDLAAIVDHRRTASSDDTDGASDAPRSSGASLQNPLAGWEVMDR